MISILTPADIITVLPDLGSDESQDTLSSTIQDDINDAEDDIGQLIEVDLEYDISAPTDHQKDLLCLLEWFWPAAKLVDKRGSAKPGTIDFNRWSSKYFSIYQLLRELLATGLLVESFKPTDGIAIPRIALCTGQQAANDIPSCKLTANSFPTVTVADTWARWWSSLFYSLGALQCYPIPSDINSLNRRQLNAYQTPVKWATAAMIARTRMSNYTEGESPGQTLSDRYFGKGLFNIDSDLNQFINNEHAVLFH